MCKHNLDVKGEAIDAGMLYYNGARKIIFNVNQKPYHQVA
jgi:hypothetical protein